MTSIALTSFSKGRRFGSSQGFTLIELIAGLVLLGILAAVLGTGIVGALNIYTISEENVHLAQKGQNAMARINRELSELTEIIERNDTDPFIVYGNLRGTGVHAIRFDSANHRLLLYSDLPDDTTALDPDDASDILVDHVAGFAITYLRGSESWPVDGNPRHLSHIKTQLTLSRTRSVVTQDETFTGLAYLRNTLNYGGAAPATEPPQPPALNAYDCFINATDDDRHPMVPFPEIVAIIIMMLAAAAGLMTFSHRKNRKYESGSALIAVIVALLTFSAIAAALLPLVSSSGQQAVAQDRAEKAYLLAESGFRYAAGKYVHAASDSDKVQALEALHDTQYQTGQGRFALELYPYFYQVKGDISPHASSFLANVPGGLPPEVEALASHNGLELEMTTGNEILKVDNINVTVGGDVIFILSEMTTEPISAGTLIYPTAASTGEQELINGGSLTVPNIDMFPSRNGYIRLADRDLNYRTKDAAGNRLVGVVDLNDPDMSLSISSGDRIVLHRHVQLASTGVYGSGQVEASRTVTYDTPLYFNNQTQGTTTYEDHFDAPDLDTHWDSVWGTNEIVEQDGNRRLEVSGEENAIGTQEMSLISLDSEEADQALRSSYKRSGNYLSYDVQVKVGFDTDPRGISDSDDENYYFASGLCFRLDVEKGKDYDSYGVSIIRGGEGPVDNIKSDIVPEAMHDKIALVLWRQTDYAVDNSWLAYKNIETAGWPVQDATLLVRIKEAKVLSFHSVGDVPIQKGNVVVGDTSGAHGRVIQGPVLSNTRTWSSGTQGYVLLNSDAGDFLSSEDLRVAGKGVLAEVASFNNVRTNIIRVYFGRSQHCENDEDNATDSPRDSTVLCYPIGTSPLLWPPDLENDGSMTWPKEDDFFQLVQWDDVNGAQVLVSHEDLEKDAIIVHHEDALQTPSDGDLGDRAEIGLHAFGKGSANVYFDDFGLQLIRQNTAVIPTPLQQ